MQFDEFMAEIETEAHAQGPEALAELEAFRAHFAQVRTLQLLDRLQRVIRPAYLPKWLITPIPALDDDPPIKRIGSGDTQSVERLLSGLEDPGAS